MSSKSKAQRQYRVFVFSFLARNESGSPFTMYCTSCRCFRVKVQTLGCLISTCQVRVRSRLPPSSPPPRRWCGEAPLPLPRPPPSSHTLNKTPVSQDCLVESTPDPGPRRCEPWAHAKGKVTTAYSLRSRHGREPDTGQYRGDSSVAFTAGPPPCLHGRVCRIPRMRTIEPGKSIIAWCTMLPQEY
jgi:hypothetical protein